MCLGKDGQIEGNLMVTFAIEDYGGSVAIYVYFSFAGLYSTMDGTLYSRTTPRLLAHSCTL